MAIAVQTAGGDVGLLNVRPYYWYSCWAREARVGATTRWSGTSILRRALASNRESAYLICIALAIEEGLLVR